MSVVIHRGPRRLALGLCLALLALAAGHPARALAGQIVYPAGTGIWAMNEDGCGAYKMDQAKWVAGKQWELVKDPASFGGV